MKQHTIAETTTTLSALVCVKTSLDMIAEMRRTLSTTPSDFENLRRDMLQAPPSISGGEIRDIMYVPVDCPTLKVCDGELRRQSEILLECFSI
jgi:hypothetical protein